MGGGRVSKRTLPEGWKSEGGREEREGSAGKEGGGLHDVCRTSATYTTDPASLKSGDGARLSVLSAPLPLRGIESLFYMRSSTPRLSRNAPLCASA